MTNISAVFGQPFKEQVAFFKQKLNLPTQHYDEILHSQHDRAFIVAGAMKAELLTDLRESVRAAIEDGETLAQFRQRFNNIVQKHGWTGWTGEGSEAGVAWRTKVIYATNLRTSHAAGRWQQMTDPDVMAMRPYWRYRHTTIEHPRMQHKQWDGLILPAKDEWFLTHYPPNGWGCKCKVETLSKRDLQKLGKSTPDKAPSDGTYQTTARDGSMVELPNGVQYGWGYAAGVSVTQQVLTTQVAKLTTKDNAIARLYTAELLKSTAFERFFNGKTQGEWPIAVLKTEDMKAIGAQSAVVMLSQESLAAHIKKHPELGLEDYRKIQKILDTGEVWQQSSERLVYLVIDNVRYRAALKRTKDGGKNYFLSLFIDNDQQPPKGSIKIRDKI